MTVADPSRYLAAQPEVVAFAFEEDGNVPNNPLLPLLVFRSVLSDECPDMAAAFELLYLKNGWEAPWIWGVYAYHHYHATTHEVLGCIGGTASILFGGEGGETLAVERGDLVIIPAGVGHKNLSCSEDFQMAGSYPEGSGCDIKRDTREDHNVSVALIGKVPLPRMDPLYGVAGPMREHWA